MKKQLLLLPFLGLLTTPGFSQNTLVTLGSSTTVGLGTTSLDSSWVRRVNRYYKAVPGVLDTVYNLGVSGTTVYRAMPTSYSPPAGRPAPDTARNVTKANALLTGTTTNGVVIVNFPSNGYDNYSIAEVLARLQTVYDSVTAAGHRCFVTTTQPRSDGAFKQPAIRLKMAVLKDSIINRFGVARTLNFWDGMYNPADTSILPAYSAGDSVHFNNAGHRELFARVVAKNIFGLSTPTTGDYRSAVNPTGVWSSAGSWEVYNGTAWVGASAPPDSNSGTVTILAGDSIRVNDATSLDGVRVDSGGILAFFNTATPLPATTTFTLANGAGEDLSVFGKLYVSAGATLAGNGTVHVAPAGQFILRNQGTLNATTLNEGTTRVSGTGNISVRTFTNNGTFLLVDFTLNLNNGAALVNNDSVAVLFASNAFFASTSGTGTFSNAAGAVLCNVPLSGVFSTTSTVAFSNAGTVKGSGQYVFQNVASNTGIISPGSSPGTLTVNPGFITGRTPTLFVEVASAATPPDTTTYDRLLLSTVNSSLTNVSGVNLVVADAGTDPVGTVYTIVRSAGTITGTFASISLPSHFGNLTYGANTITVQKIASNPLSTGLLSFTAEARESVAQLRWEMNDEKGLEAFVVERSADGRAFSGIGSVAARGQGSTYLFTDAQPGEGTVYYRLRMNSAGGTAFYSSVKTLHFGKNGEATVRVWPNPAGSVIYLQLSEGPASVSVVDARGVNHQLLRLEAGMHTISLEGLPAGTYSLVVRQEGRPARIQRFVHL